MGNDILTGEMWITIHLGGENYHVSIAENTYFSKFPRNLQLMRYAHDVFNSMEMSPLTIPPAALRPY